MGKKKSKKAKSRFIMSSLGMWVQNRQTGTWTLNEDQRFSLYLGTTQETRGQWFLVQRKLLGFMALMGPTEPVTPFFLGDSFSVERAVDLADIEITRRRLEQPQEADA